MKDVTQEVMDLWYNYFETSGDDVFITMLSRFRDRKTTVYEVSHLQHILENYDSFSKDQYWPLYASGEYYMNLIDPKKNRLTDAQRTYLKLVAPSKEAIEAPTRLVKIEDVVVDELYGIFGIHTFQCRDSVGNPFFMYSVLETVVNYVKDNHEKKFGLLLQPTQQKLTIQNKDISAPLFSLLYSSPEEDDDDGNVLVPKEEPVLSF